MAPRRGKQINYVRTYCSQTVSSAETVSADVESLLARLVAQAYLKDHPLAQREQTSEDQDADQKA